jgi:16S rRNA (guanine1207-N2)-methyltransferase
MPETRLSVPQGQFDLIRYPPTRDPTLRAWDAADELLLSHVSEVINGRPVPRVDIVNDSFGALTVAAAGLSRPEPPKHVRFVSDSHVASMAMRQNLERNGIPQLTEPEVPEPDLVLVKVPKALSLLEAQLVELRETLTPETAIVGGGMTRDVHSSTIELFKRVIGPTRTSLAKKKARLIFSSLDPELTPERPLPTRFPLGIQDVQVVSYPGVFSAKRLDSGTSLLLDNLPVTADSPDVIDLGCGNGVLGVAVALPGAFRQPTFRVGDCLDGLRSDSADLIVCNPPFHQGRVQQDDVAWKMFTGAKRVLRPGGELWVVGNRHLEYYGKLKRAFGNSQLIASNSRFQVIRALR